MAQEGYLQKPFLFRWDDTHANTGKANEQFSFKAVQHYEQFSRIAIGLRVSKCLYFIEC